MASSNKYSSSSSRSSTKTNTINYNKYKSNKKYAKQLKKAEKYQPTFNNQYANALANSLSNLENQNNQIDLGSNQVYQDYANDYRLLGNIAADQNAMQTEALSGGYGTTYSGDVANQNLEGYLASEKNIIPSLYQTEKAIYNQDVANAINKANLYNTLEAQDYNEFLGKLEAWNNNREYYYNKWYNDYLAHQTSREKGTTSTNTSEYSNGTSSSISNVSGGSGRSSTKAKYSKLNGKAVSSRDGAMAYLANNGLDASNVISKEQFAAENASRGWNAYNGALYEEGEKGYSEKNKKQLDKDYQDYLLNYIRQAQGLDDTDWFTKKQKRLGYSNKKH